MKFARTFFLLASIFLMMNAHRALAQKANIKQLITLQARDSSLSFFLNEISKQADINFAINLERVNVQKKLSLNIVNQRVVDVLDSITQHLDLTYKVLKKQVIIKPLKGANLGNNNEAENKTNATVSGYLKDKENGEVLIGATVYVPELNTGTTTNGYGFYSLTLPHGNYKLWYGFLGFETQEFSVELKKDYLFDVELQTLQIALKEVEIKGETAGMNFLQNQIAHINFKKDEVQKTPGFMGEVEVIKSLQNHPGIKSHGDGSMFFYVRGGNKDQNLILIDEAPVYTPSHLFGFFSSFIPEAIKDVNVYKSDIPLELGGTLSSVVDIKTKEGNMKRTGFEGSLGFISNRFMVEGPIFKEKLAYFVSVRKSSPLFGGFNFSDFNFKVNWKINHSNRIFVAAYSGKDDFSNFGGESSNFGLKWENATFTLRWNHLFGNKLFLNTTLYTSRYDYFLLANKNENLFWNEQITNGSIKFDFTWYPNTKNTCRFGASTNAYFFNPGNFNKEIIKGPPRKNANQAVIYGSNEQQLGEKFRLKYGIRLNSWQNIGSVDETEYLINKNYQVYDTIHPANKSVYHTYGNWEPRISLAYEPDSISAVKLSYGRTVQYVQLLSNSTSPFTSADVWVPASPNIQPQKADQISLGYTRLLKDETIQWGTEVFYKLMRNQIEVKDHGNLLLNPVIDAELRFGKAWAYGLETWIKKQGEKLEWQLGYSYARVHKKIKGVNKNRPYSALYDRPHQITTALGYTISERVRTSFTWNYTSGGAYTTPTAFYYENGKQIPVYEARNNDRLPAYHRLDLALQWRINKSTEKRFQHQLHFSVFNFYGRKNPFALSFSKEKVGRNAFKIPLNVLENKKLVGTELYFGGPVPTISYHFKL